MSADDQLWDPTRTAVYLGTAMRTLANWRHEGFGPPYVKVGSRVRYRRCDIEAWLATRAEKRTPIPSQRLRSVAS